MKGFGNGHRVLKHNFLKDGTLWDLEPKHEMNGKREQ